MPDQQIDYAALAAEHGGTERAAMPPPATPTAKPGHDYKILGVNIHVPGEEKPRLDSNMVGWGEQGAGIAPEDALIGGQAARAVAKAASAGGAIAGLKSSVAQASPIIKYELTRSTLTAMGVPEHYASLAALAISGLKKGPKPEAIPEGPHLDRSVGMRPGQMTQEQIGERLRSGTGTPPPQAGPKPKIAVTAAEPVAVAPGAPALPAEPVARSSPPPPIGELASSRPSGAALPDQKALNEEALTRRRAEYQARTAAPAKPANVKLNAAETSAYLNLMLKGQSSSEAMASVLQQRELIAALGTPTPTAAQTRFPKGMRGKATPSQ